MHTVDLIPVGTVTYNASKLYNHKIGFGLGFF